MKAGKIETGIKRLDDLLDGGLPELATALVYGPPFIGKEVLAKLYYLHGLRQGIPGIMILTGDAASDVRAALTKMDPSFPEYEKRGLAHFVDTYSRSIGAEDDQPNCEYVDTPVNLNAVSLAVNNAQRKLIADHPHHRLVFESVSTLITYTNAQTTFRFLQVLIGKAKRAGATSLLLLDHGMHTDAEVQTFKHLCDGVIEVKADGPQTTINVVGVGVTENRGWVEYKFSDKTFDITGSFGAGRIR